MSRIRTIKPEFWQDEKIGPLAPIDRLVFVGLISLADDAGRLVDSVKTIDGVLFSYREEDSSRESLDTLARLSRITRYTSASGQRLIQINGWSKHQKVDKPSRYTLPPPEAPEQSRDSSETVAESSRSDLGSYTNDLGPPSRSRDAHAGGLNSAPSWLGEISTVYDACCGAGSFHAIRGYARRYLPKVIEAHGVRDVCDHLRVYLAQTDARYRSVQRFAANYDAYMPVRPLFDGDGNATEYYSAILAGEAS